MPPLRCCLCYHCLTLFYLHLISIILLRNCVIGFHERKKKRRNEAQKQQHDVLRRKLSEKHKKSCFSGSEPYLSCLPLICLQRKRCLILWLRLWPKKTKGAGNK